MNGARWRSYLVRIISWATVNIFCLLPSLSPVDYVRQWSQNQYLVLMTLLIMVADPVFYLLKRSWWIGSRSSRARSCWRSPQPTCLLFPWWARELVRIPPWLTLRFLHLAAKSGLFCSIKTLEELHWLWLGTTLALNALQWNPGNDRNINCKC